MLIKNVKIFTERKCFVPGAVLVKEDRIGQIILGEQEGKDGMLSADTEIIDGHGAYCIPGMIDLHFHGCKGYDICDGTKEAMDAIARYEASIGVTAIAPATMTLPAEDLKQILANAAAFRQEQERSAKEEIPFQADLLGINMEGPFISPVKKGAQDDAYILPCDTALFESFQKAAQGLVRFIGLAPEEAGSGQAERFIEEVKGKVTVSLAHTNAGYDAAKAAFDAGAGHLIHMYNAMPPFLHREPGVIGAAADSPHVMAEIICDGVHVHPSAVRGALSLIGEERMIFISDSMRAAGMPDGLYTLGGQDVQVKGKYATLLSDGSLAGSVTPLPDCVRTAVKEMDVPLETAVACATIHPARSLGVEEKYGSIAPGKKANLLLWDEELELKLVMKDGRIIRQI